MFPRDQNTLTILGNSLSIIHTVMSIISLTTNNTFQIISSNAEETGDVELN
jgi:hypothetical protein